MPEGAAFCTQCGGRTLVAGNPAGESDATQVVPAVPDPAPEVTADPDPTQVVPQTVAPASPSPSGFAAPEAPPAAASPPPATADPTQTWSAPPAAPAAQGWPAAPGMAPAPPPATPSQPAASPLPPGGAGWQAPTQTWDQPPVAPVPPYPTAGAPQQFQPQPGAPAYAPAPIAAPKAAKSSSGGKFGAFVGLIGGALGIVGSFLAWVKIAPGNDLAYTVTGWKLSNDAKITVAIGAVAVVLAVLVIGGHLRGLVRLLFAVGGIALLGVAIYDTYDILKKLPDRLAGSFPDGGAKITGPEIGLILIIAGGVLLFIAALFMKKPKTDVQGFTRV